MELGDRQLEMVEEYKKDIMSGRTFALHAASSRSQHGYMPPITRSGWAHCQSTLARMATQSDPLAQVAVAIMGRVNLYGDRSQATASVYDAAGEALRTSYTDVIRLAGPEPGRRSDAQRDYTLAERTEIMCWLEIACRPFASSVSGIGWCLQRVVEDCNVRQPTMREGTWADRV